MHFASSKAASAAASFTKTSTRTSNWLLGQSWFSDRRIESQRERGRREPSCCGVTPWSTLPIHASPRPLFFLAAQHPGAGAERSGAARRSASHGVLRRLRERTWSKERSRACCAPFAVRCCLFEHRTSSIRDVYVLPHATHRLMLNSPSHARAHDLQPAGGA